MEDSKENEIKIAGIVEESIVDGPGIRFTVFVQGCLHKCEDCHNSHTQSFDEGEIISADILIEKIKANPLIDGITLSGGEPFEQSKAVSKLAKKLKELGYHVITYSGYTYEQIEEKSLTEPSYYDLLDNTDILIDGRFDKSKRNLTLNFRGSENQRVIDVKASRYNKRITTIDL